MIQIIQIIKRAEQGITKPFLCRANDKNLYWVKGNDTGKYGLCSEWIAGKIGEDFGLPIPYFTLVEVHEEIINESKVKNVKRDLGAGIWFASKHIDYVDDFKYVNILEVDIELRIKILVFDWWIKNNDRNLGHSGGNVNLLWNSIDKKLYVIDHNLAFDNKFSINILKNNHVFSNVLNNAKKEVADNLINEMKLIVKNFRTYCSYLPDLWIEESNINLSKIENTLLRINKCKILK